MLAVLGKGCRADDLDFASGERGFKNVCRIHAALGITCSDDVMHLVNDKNDIALLAYLLNKPLHAAFKLASELCACNKCGEVKQIDLLIAQLIRHLVEGNALRKPLGDRRLADTGLADETGVVLLAAVEYLNDALELLLPADHIVKLAGSCPVGEVNAVVVQKLFLCRSAAVLLLGSICTTLRRICVLSVLTAEQPVEKRKGRGLTVVLGIIRLAVYIHQALNTVEGIHHITAKAVKIFIGNAHLIHHILYGLYVQFTGTLKAKAFIFGLVALHLRNKHNCYIFAAA